MDKIEKATDELIEAIKESDIFLNYEMQKEKVQKQPELKQRINEFRQQNYMLQNSVEADKLFDQVDCFQKEYESFREIPLVNDFLNAELGFCRMMQEINARITEAVDFE